MCLKVRFLGVLLAITGFGQVARAQSTDNLSARELYYREEKPANDALPAIAAAGAGASSQPARPRPKPRKEPANTGSTMAPKQPKATSADRDSRSSHSDNGVNDSDPVRLVPAAIPVVEHLGLRYSLLLVDKEKNTSAPVDPDRVFHNGDCLALELEPNRTGYLYVFAKASNGNYDPLFPAPQMQDESEVVLGRTKQRAPQNYCFELDDQPGEEHLYLILSRNPERAYDLHKAVLQRDGTPEGGAAANASSKLIADADQLNKQATETVAELTNRGFKLTKVSAPQSGEAKYSVYVVPASIEKDTVFADIRIKHQSGPK